MTSALLFGSIGTLVDTSELQRQAFNQAFVQHGLDWHWEREDYIAMLEKSGGRQRIEDYAKEKGVSVNADAIHKSKSEIFQQLMKRENIEPREGVEETIKAAKKEGLKLALVTTTSENNVDTMLSAIGDRIDKSAFDLIVDKSMVTAGKPATEAYQFALEKLEQTANDCVAIEDNVDGVKSATASGITCVAFPGENNRTHSFDTASCETDSLTFLKIKPLFGNLHEAA